MALTSITSDGPTITVSTSEELIDAYAQLSIQSGGGTILMQGGDYGYLSLYGSLGGDEPVIIASADADDPADFEQLYFNNVSNVRIENVHVDSSVNGDAGSSLVHIANGSENVEIVDVEINGKIDSIYDGYYGIRISNSSDIGFYGSDVHDVKNGIYVEGSDGIEVIDNSFDRLGNDTMKFAGVSDVLIENNIGPQLVFPEEGAHLDFIQFQGSDSSDIVIRGNVLLPGNWTDLQGIFMDDAHYTNVLIEQNIIVTGMIRGISVSSGTNVVARDNTVLDLEGYGSKATKIMVDGESYGNIQSSYLQDTGQDTNLTLQQTHPDEPLHYDDVFLNADVGMGVTIEDLTPTTNSLAYDYGATERLLELLGAAPDTTGEDPSDETPDSPGGDDEVPVDEEPTEIVLFLVDVNTDEVIMELASGDELPLDVLGRSDVSLVVDVNQDVGSVRLSIGDFVQVENAEPYALFGDNSGDFGGSDEPLFDAVGDYSLGIELFSGANASGSLLAEATYGLTLSEVEEEPPAEDPPAEDPPAEDPPTEDPPAEEPPADEDPGEDPGDRGEPPEAVESSGGSKFFLLKILEAIFAIFGGGGSSKGNPAPLTEEASVTGYDTTLADLVPVTETLDEDAPGAEDDDDEFTDLAA